MLPILYAAASLLALIGTTSLMIIGCSGSAKKEPGPVADIGEDVSRASTIRAPPSSGGASESGKESGTNTKSDAVPKAPANKAKIADTHDPNYQTLAGVPGGGHCFGRDKAPVKVAPASVDGGGGADDNYVNLPSLPIEDPPQGEV